MSISKLTCDECNFTWLEEIDNHIIYCPRCGCKYEKSL